MTSTQLAEAFRPDSDLARMRAEIMNTIRDTETRRTRRHRIAAVAASGLVVLGTTAGALAVAAAPQGQINYTADCYATASLRAQHGTSLYLPGDQNDAKATPLKERVALAEGMCAETWKIGTFQDGTVPSGATFPVPRLVTCELSDDRLAVFPSTASAQQTCGDLGLSTPRD